MQRNIVFVLVDDLRFDAMGFLRPSLQTPNIDRVALSGVHFENAFVTSSLCSPSRATILTGLSMRNHGVVDNNDAPEDDLTYFPTHLQAAGYQTGFFGKWHFGRHHDQPRPGFDRWVSFVGQETTSHRLYVRGPTSPPARRTGSTWTANTSRRPAI